jgi:DNA polymerase bacteriophage-type
VIHCDFETYSELDVRHVGAYRYAEHPSTEVLIMCYAFDGGKVKTWLPGMKPPLELFCRVEENEEFSAHNVEFEYCMWNIVLHRMLKNVPRLRAEQLNCTAGRAAMCGLPRSLGKAGAAAGLEIQKDKRGVQLINFFCKPRKVTKKNDDTRNLPEFYPEAFQEFIDYCITDVESERELDAYLPAFSPFDFSMYRLCMRVNSRGIPVDIAGIKKAGVIVRELERRAHKRVTELTKDIRPTQRDKLMGWLAKQGVEIENLQANTVKALLSNADIELSDDVRTLLELRMEASKVSTKKLISMLRVACADSRVRGTLLFYGAHTGRLSGKLIQPHNFIRGLPDKKAQIALMQMMFPLLEKGDADLIEILFDNPLTSIAQCMRGFIKAGKGKIFRIVDYAQIEARILVWLAGQDDVLEAFRRGEDVYRQLAAFLWNISEPEVTSDQRRIAKNLVLGCGFGLGWEKFIEYCEKREGLVIEEAMSRRAVRAYRARNPKVVDYWDDVERCAIAAVRDPGKNVNLRNVNFYCEPDKRFLRIILPSGRSLFYPSPRVVLTERFGVPKPQLTFMTEIKGMWLRTTTYGGRLVENIVQGVAADIMMAGGIKAEAANYPLVLTVHDEWLSECNEDFGSLKELERLCCSIAPWITNCPVTAEGFETVRYRKN